LQALFTYRTVAKRAFDYFTVERYGAEHGPTATPQSAELIDVSPIGPVYASQPGTRAFREFAVWTPTKEGEQEILANSAE
jgi:hypothetical protein